MQLPRPSPAIIREELSMSVLKPEDVVISLRSPDSEARLRALRQVKNQIIGNRTKKLEYLELGAVPKVVYILATEKDSTMLVQVRASLLWPLLLPAHPDARPQCST